MWVRRKGGAVPTGQYADVTAIGINFMMARKSKPSAYWGATGWTIVVEPAWKQPLRSLLASLPDRIDSDTMYPPLGEVRRLAIVEASRALAEM